MSIAFATQVGLLVRSRVAALPPHSAEVLTLKALASSSSGRGGPQPARGGSVCFETLGLEMHREILGNSEGVATDLPEGSRLQDCDAFPRLPKQPWTETSQRFQRKTPSPISFDTPLCVR